MYAVLSLCGMNLLPATMVSLPAAVFLVHRPPIDSVTLLGFSFGLTPAAWAVTYLWGSKAATCGPCPDANTMGALRFAQGTGLRTLLSMELDAPHPGSGHVRPHPRTAHPTAAHCQVPEPNSTAKEES
ncbi:hypothetical protein ABZ027_36655 [Streptomyces sp. NPDC006332]|uniref:hypothetical protein n=1 Tax=Streptomyces sp. NPDC006332 TaxID=3155456 RepID=UPI0033BB1F7C